MSLTIDHTVKKPFDKLLLHLQLILIAERLVAAATAHSKMRTNRRSILKFRLLQNLKESAVGLALLQLRYAAAHLLAFYRTLNCYFSVIHMKASLVRELICVYHTFNYIVFLHSISNPYLFFWNGLPYPHRSSKNFFLFFSSGMEHQPFKAAFGRADATCQAFAKLDTFDSTLGSSFCAKNGVPCWSKSSSIYVPIRLSLGRARLPGLTMYESL